MKFGRLTSPTRDILKEIRTTRKLGFDFVEIAIEGPEGKPEIIMKKRRQILKLLKKYKMFALGHTSWWMELGSEYEPVRRGWIEEGKKIIRLCNKLGIKLLNLHSHSRGTYLKNKKGREVVLKNIIKSLKELIKYGKKYDVELMLENAAERGEIRKLKNFKYIIDRTPGLKVHLDIGHAFINGGMKAIESYIKIFKNKIVHVHIHDNHGYFDEHLPLGKGKMNYKKVIKLLKKINYDRTITFEEFSKDPNSIKKSMKKVKKLL
ncbi:MAG: TIM barrel protein [Candidatus Aenigmarchaeota archaeon]|nr:TIM barrel protein [Candidatus Aenigmarchaeota archaeon]